VLVDSFTCKAVVICASIHTVSKPVAGAHRQTKRNPGTVVGSMQVGGSQLIVAGQTQTGQLIDWRCPLAVNAETMEPITASTWRCWTAVGA